MDTSGMIKCPVCGKWFIVPVATIYRLNIKGKRVIFCSYTCYRKEQIKIDAKRKK
jgi:YHS domain-containing protein